MLLFACGVGLLDGFRSIQAQGSRKEVPVGVRALTLLHMFGVPIWQTNKSVGRKVV